MDIHEKLEEYIPIEIKRLNILFHQLDAAIYEHENGVAGIMVFLAGCSDVGYADSEEEIIPKNESIKLISITRIYIYIYRWKSKTRCYKRILC